MTINFGLNLTVLRLAITSCFMTSLFSEAADLNNLEYPKNWGKLSISRVENSECPNITGSYDSTGETFQVKNDEADSSSENNYRGNAILVPYNKKPIAFLNGENQKYESVFVITNQNEKQFDLIESDIEPKSVVRYRYSQESNEYVCSKGWIIFPKDYSTSSGEWSNRTFTSDTRVTSLTDGSLLVYFNQNIKTKKLFGFSKEINTEELVRFGAKMESNHN
jgi:hypothetical protein